MDFGRKVVIKSFMYLPQTDCIPTKWFGQTVRTLACPLNLCVLKEPESMTTTINFWACHSLEKCVMKPPIIFLCFRLMKMNVGDCVFMIVVC